MLVQIIIYPYYKAGPIELGNNFNEVRSLFQGEYSPSIFKVEIGKVEYYNNGSFEVGYNKTGAVEFIGISKPITVYYEGMNLSNFTYTELVNKFELIDNEIYVEPGSSIIFLGIGVGFYFDDMMSDSKPDQIAIFERNYYNEYLSLYEKKM